MKLIIIAVGHRMPGWVDEAYADYAKRMPPDLPIELREVRPEPRTTGKTAAQMQALEARRIEAALPAGGRWLALDERGRDLTTMDLSGQMRQWRDDGQDVALLIGGPDGLDPDLKRRCHGMLRLSSLTLPHGMVRVLLAEQLYRAWSILANHPYHRGG
ncbi:MAG: 23S rRNA (pseudouridine(1915)-N(3))-methyltransferase RlmH [Bordetella sp. SCN 67-23]|nr:23S rRNA (pseudouridine(1915)-N(3))-methyltransferase RlmH [Burkholderiales bacterium]ODS70942.1 MAG: 23S rRNA (pseudouridine(1915)-N(3))-methyltransferase RlmH [Bordetella sp. SCN 67-23]ODU82086.1 MAG: 23S rRNA (pseudouridine(1915)-N(3))-methyltransferase RlmH [Bordetella sp. SCN 68-11]OJW90010.1 MAG: 23S rRNA (pseudouridine(1915)-N(3))-methyltransferase RlmH [Burkholderiales bacterium 67-32]